VTMKILSALALSISLLLSAGGHAKSPPAQVSEPDEAQLVEHGHYTNKRGEKVHGPAHTKDDKTPTGASAKCRDGSFSFSHSHRGTCSRHGGVASWM